MTRAIRAVTAQALELVVFGLGLLVPLWADQWIPEGGKGYAEYSWSLPLLLVSIYFILGAVRFPWNRRVASVGIAAFLAPLWIVGWIDWRIQYFLFFEHSDAWQNLPRVIASPSNLGLAALVCASAVLGRRLATLQRASARVDAV